MRKFTSEDGREWVATAAEEDAPRHHGRWYMMIRPVADPDVELVLPEVRWQTPYTAERSIRTMSEFELRRRLRMATNRLEPPARIRDSFGAWPGAGPGAKGGSRAG
jgi:hypothetical protein